MTWITNPYRFGVSSWTYASLSAAESSGDGWTDGDTVNITGGATFVYKSALAVDGYSGLIHKYVWDGTGTLGTLKTVGLNFSEAEGDDPDTWASGTDVSTGTKTTDYDLDTNVGLARMRDITTGGQAAINLGSAPVSADAQGFLILDKLDLTTTQTSNPFLQISLWVYYDASNTRAISLIVADTETVFKVNHTNSSTYASTTININGSHRVWMYVKDGRWAVWKDGDSTPNVSGTVPRSLASQTRNAYFSVGNSSTAGATDLEMGRIVCGNLTTS